MGRGRRSAPCGDSKANLTGVLTGMHAQATAAAPVWVGKGGCSNWKRIHIRLHALSKAKGNIFNRYLNVGKTKTEVDFGTCASECAAEPGCTGFQVSSKPFRMRTQYPADISTVLSP